MSWGREHWVAQDEARRSDLVDIAAEKRAETEKAILLFDGLQSVWVPKSQVEEYGDGTFAMPEWLAKDKGLI